MSTRSKVGWWVLAAALVCAISFLNGAFGGIVAAGLGAWAVVVLRNPRRSAIGAAVLGYPILNRGRHVMSAMAELGLAFVIVFFAFSGANIRSEREAKEKARIEAEQREADRKAGAARDSDLRAHGSEAVAKATALVADLKRDLEQGDYSAAMRALSQAKAIVTPYEDLHPAYEPIATLAAQVHEDEQHLEVIGNVKRTLADGPEDLSKAAASIKEKDYLAADKVFETMLVGLDVPKDSAPFVPMVDVKKLRSTVEGRRRTIGAGLKKQKAEVAAAQVYEELCGERPALSAWDGEVIGLERHIKETANDPDSIDVEKCTPPRMTDKRCWVSTCNVRGKNAFGALILLRKTYSFSKLGIEEVR
jgi:hypothetical protein